MKDAIVINATNFGRYPDGIGVYVWNLLEELARLETSLHCIIYVNRASLEYVQTIAFPRNCEIRIVTGAVSPDHGFRGHLLRLLYSNYLGLKHWRSVMFVASQLEAVLFRRNQIIMIHDIIPLLFGSLHKKQYFYFKYVLKIVLRRAQWVVTPSHHTKYLLVEYYGIDHTKVHVIHNGVRQPLTMLEERTTHRTVEGFILFSGRIVPMKNLAGLLRAFRLIKDKIPHRIVITGRCRQKDQWRAIDELINDDSIERDRVEFKGHVSQDDLVALMRGASLLAFPSLYEGFGLPPLEAMALGCPVLVSNTSSLPEVCADAAYYVDPKDPNAIAEGLQRMLLDEDLRATLVEKGLARARLFQWKDSARRHLSLFHQALSIHRPALDLRALQWKVFAMMEARPVFAFIVSLFVRHHHLR